MLDIGWSEMAMVALLALIVIGPKDLPKVMRSIGQWTRKARSVAREFQSGLDDMMRESELDEARKTVERTRNFKVDEEIEREVDPDGSVRKEAGELDRSAREDDSSDGGATTVARETPTAPGHSVGAGKPQQQTGGAKSSGGSKAAGTKSGAAKSGAAKSGSGKSGGSKSGGTKSAGTKSTGAKSAGTKSTGTKSAGAGKSATGGSAGTSGAGAAKSGGSASGGGKTSGGSKGTSKSSGGKSSTNKTSGSKATS